MATDPERPRPSPESLAKLARVRGIIKQQNKWRGRETLNWIASENPPSRAVREVQISDFMARYAEGHPNRDGQVHRYYQGTKFIDEIELMAEQNLRELMGCRQVDVRPISGNAANTAIALGFLRGGDVVVANDTAAGGHISHGAVGVFGRRIQERGRVLMLGRNNSIPLHTFPLTEDKYHIDVPKAVDLIAQVKPRLAVLGRSLFLFPEPVIELAEVCRDLKIPILYDGAHVLGLIAGGLFQQPLKEGATWMSASTHKTFPGPQRGVIFADLDEQGVKEYWTAADRGVFPGSSSNHHLATLPALVVATIEMQEYGREYAAQTVANAQTLGRALDHLGIPVEAKDFGFTLSHQIALNVAGFGGGKAVSQRLEANDIITNCNLLPGDTDARQPCGIRMGVQEMTRFGMKEDAIKDSAQLITDAIRGMNVKAEVNELRRQYTKMLWTT